MVLTKPNTCIEEFGVKRFLLTPEQYMEPCLLFDLMTEDVDVCAAGVFVGQLGHLPQHNAESLRHQVEIIKSFLKDDRERNGYARQFMPAVQERRCLWPEYGSMYIVPQLQRGKAYCHGRREWMDSIISCDFFNKPKTGLECALESGGIDHLLDKLYEGLADQERVIWYGPGLSLPKGKSLEVSPDLSMTKMNSPYIDKLVNRKNTEQTIFQGINSPTIYIGTEFSTFNCHIEDFAFESINRLISGSEKIWFIVPPAYYNSFCTWMSLCGVPQQFANCSTFLQHKHNFIDPRAAVRAGFPVRTVRQRVGDVLYVLPHAIHWGFNIGYNLNEAVNSASKSWMLSGMLSKPMCTCNIAMESMQNVEIDNVLKETGAPLDLYNRWKKSQLFGIMPTLNLRNPYSAVAGVCQTDLALLLGRAAEVSDEDCKEVTSIMTAFAGHPHEHFIGGLVCLDDDDDVEDEKHESTGVLQNEEPVSEEDEANKEKSRYQCPDCEFAVKYRGLSAKSSLISHIKKSHKDTKKLTSIVEKAFAKKKPTCQQVFQCQFCGEERVGGPKRKEEHEAGCSRKKLKSMMS